MAYRWSEREVEGVSVLNVCDEILRSAPGDAGRIRRNKVAAALERVRRCGPANSIADRQTGVRSNFVALDEELAARFYWSISGRFLVLLQWRFCSKDKTTERSAHRDSLIECGARLERLLAQIGGPLDG